MVLGTKIWALLAGGTEPCGSSRRVQTLAQCFATVRFPLPCAGVFDSDPGLLVILG